MRPVLLCAALLLAAACAPDAVPNPPPAGRFYFPTGIAYAASGDDAGVLLVASSNFDKRYDRGALNVVKLADVELPELGAEDGGAPREVADLRLGAGQTVYLQSFAGELALWHSQNGIRAFVASRAEGSPLQFIDWNGSALSCEYAPAGSSQDCYSGAPSLTALDNKDPGKPRAPAPSGIYVTNYGDAGVEDQVFVSHFLNADSPPGSRTNEESFIVTTSPSTPDVIETPHSEGGSFISIGPGGASSVLATPRWLFATGRFVQETEGGQLLRVVERANESNVFSAGLEGVFHSAEARGLAMLNPDTVTDSARLYLLARDPDELLVIDVSNMTGAQPSLKIVRQLPLPDSPNDIKLLARPGQGPLAVVSCSGDDSVVIYDDDSGSVVSRLAAGDQPYAIAIQSVPGNPPTTPHRARIFASNYGDGRVAVIDIADVFRPGEARLVAHLGRSQQCIVNGANSSLECENEPQ